MKCLGAHMLLDLLASAYILIVIYDSQAARLEGIMLVKTHNY